MKYDPRHIGNSQNPRSYVSMKEFDSEHILQLQHQLLLQSATTLKSLWTKGLIEECRNQSHQLLESLREHHHLEFETLFSKLIDNPNLNLGGPFCAYFFEFFMMNRPIEAALKLINRNREAESKLSNIQIPESLKLFFEQNSMLSIPIEEHMAEDAILVEICACFDKDPMSNSQWIDQALNLLEDIIKMNIQKEETCLWVLSRQIFSINHTE